MNAAQSISHGPLYDRFSTRLAILAALFAAELLAISMWLDNGMLAGSHGLSALLRDWGPFGVRVVVASALAFVILGESEPAVRSGGDVGPFSWTLASLHAVAMAAFAALSTVVYAKHLSPMWANVSVLAWGAAGIAGIALAACALIPAAAWIEKLGSMRDLLIFAPAAGLAASILGNLARNFWEPLERWTFALVLIFLKPFVAQVLSDPAHAMIGTAKFNVEIAPECSGYEGIGLILAVTGAWLWFLRRRWRFPNALLLIPLGVAAVWILNSVRIAALILIGNAGAEGIAQGGFHSQAGWIAFSLVALAVCTVARRVPWFCSSAGVTIGAEPMPAAAAETATTAYLAPFLAILGAALIARAASSDFEWLYGLRVVAAAGALFVYRRTYFGIFRNSWLPGPGALALGTAVFAMWIALDRVTAIPAASAPAAFEHAAFAAKFSWLALRVTGAVVTVPIAEELAFRGFFLRRLAAADFEAVPWKNFAWIPFAASSIAFGVLHGERWIAGSVAGMIYAYAMIRRGRLADAIAAHSFTNLLLAAWVLITGNWQFW